MLQVHIAYLPSCSSHHVPSETLQALVKTCSRRLQIQERLTQEIADGVFSLTGVLVALCCPVLSLEACFCRTELGRQNICLVAAFPGSHYILCHEKHVQMLSSGFRRRVWRACGV